MRKTSSTCRRRYHKRRTRALTVILLSLAVASQLGRGRVGAFDQRQFEVEFLLSHGGGDLWLAKPRPGQLTQVPELTYGDRVTIEIKPRGNVELGYYAATYRYLASTKTTGGFLGFGKKKIKNYANQEFRQPVTLDWDKLKFNVRVAPGTPGSGSQPCWEDAEAKNFTLPQTAVFEIMAPTVICEAAGQARSVRPAEIPGHRGARTSPIRPEPVVANKPGFSVVFSVHRPDVP